LHFFFGKFATDEAFHGVQGVLRVGDRLTLGRGPHQHFAVFLIGNDGRRGAGTLGVFNHFGGVAFHDGHAAVGGAQVNTDDSSHDASLNVGAVAQLSCSQCKSPGGF
jgi:hypothetical protein